MQQKIDFRKNNSRPRIGETRKVSLTLKPETWQLLDDAVKYGHAKKTSALLREIIEFVMEGGEPDAGVNRLFSDRVRGKDRSENP